MLVGNGMIAMAFNKYIYDDDILLFASGVSNSKEQDNNEFQKEIDLLNFHLKTIKNKKTLNSGRGFVYLPIKDDKKVLVWEFFLKKYKGDTKPAEIRNHMFLFLNCTIINPSFSSQTKEKLITEPKDFQTAHKVSEKFAKAIFASEVVQSLLDWIEQKKQAEEKAELRKLNKSLSTAKVLKLIDAKGRDREKCSLGIFEGMSALSAVRKFRDPQTFGAFPLRGKFLNVAELKHAEVIKNEEVVQLMASLGIKLGEDARHPRYGKILIYTDADPDGDSIAGMLINFFARYWPELFAHDRVFKVMTPLVVAKKGKEVLPFYSNEDYQKWEKKTGAKGWNVEYKKGLAALEDDEYKEIIHNPVLVKIDNDGSYKESLNNWFGNDSSIRKEKLLKLSV
jgi:DNA topoisomerase-2